MSIFQSLDYSIKGGWQRPVPPAYREEKHDAVLSKYSTEHQMRVVLRFRKEWTRAISAVILAGWNNRQQPALIEFQRLQIEALLKQLGKKLILLSEDQRKLLAVKARQLAARL